MAINSSSNVYQCSESPVGLIIIIAFLVTRCFLLLPLSLLIFYLGHQRWRRQRSFATTTHSDIFSYQFAAMELICALGTMFYICGLRSSLSEMITVGKFFGSVVPPGEIFFHILACIERYMAVVHPVIYLRLKQSGGVRIRNISIGCVWLLCFGCFGVTALSNSDFLHIPTSCFMVLFLVVVSFCSLSILRVLVRPGPGEIGECGAAVDQSKKRAFCTITAIMGVLCLFIIGYLIYTFLNKLHVLSFRAECVVFILSNVVTLPSSFILPLLFLHRAGKLLCCFSSNE